MPAPLTIEADQTVTVTVILSFTSPD
jgi:hypothetical protein